MKLVLPEFPYLFPMLGNLSASTERPSCRTGRSRVPKLHKQVAPPPDFPPPQQELRYPDRHFRRSDPTLEARWRRAITSFDGAT